jgi:hypothetical protein
LKADASKKTAQIIGGFSSDLSLLGGDYFTAIVIV